MAAGNMIVSFLCLCSMMAMSLAMDSPENEFGAQDLVSIGVFSNKPAPSYSKGAKLFGKGKKVPTISKKQEAFIIATAKVSGRKHGSNPYITVDIEETSPSCGPYDWVFKPTICKAPEVNRRIWAKRVVQVRNAFLHVFSLPTGWKNSRVTLPSYGRCGPTRTSSMRPGSSTKLCLQADFRYRHCFRKTCRWINCPSMNLLIRYISHGPRDITIPYVATENGIYFCKKPTANLFLK